MLLNYTFKNGYYGKFYVIFYHNFKNINNVLPKTIELYTLNG